jgi:hypothetical protein
MRVHHSVTVIACSWHLWLAICCESSAEDFKPYPLPPAARTGIENLAKSSDILIFGEMHGTQEVPELIAGLLGPLTKLGYHTLALEVPSNEQASLLKYLRGETERIPNFFAHPNGDGRGNAQLLALARIAASSPFQWKIICFDQSELVFERERPSRSQKKVAGKAAATNFTDDDMIVAWRERDAAMASNVLRESAALKATNKVLAITGNIHARTTNDTREPMLSKLWPSFAGVLKQRQPSWRVNSMNIEFYGGGYFNNGKVQTFGKRPLKQPEVGPAGQTGWDLVLSLPSATPATFLGPIRVP